MPAHVIECITLTNVIFQTLTSVKSVLNQLLLSGGQIFGLIELVDDWIKTIDITLLNYSSKESVARVLKTLTGDRNLCRGIVQLSRHGRNGWAEIGPRTEFGVSLQRR